MEGRSLARTKFQLSNSPPVPVQSDSDFSSSPSAEFVVNYRPKSLLGHALSLLPKPTLSVGWVLVVLLTAPYAVASVTTIHKSILPFLANNLFYFGIAPGIIFVSCLIPLFFVLARALGMFNPNTIRLNHEGLRFEWSPGFGSFGLIKWEDIDSVDCRSVKGATGEHRAIVIEACTDNFSPTEKLLINFLPPIFSRSQSANQMKVKLRDDLLSALDRERLVCVIEAYVEPVKLDASLFAEIEEPKVIPYRSARPFRKALRALLKKESRMAFALSAVVLVLATAVLYWQHSSMMYLGGTIGIAAILVLIFAKCATWYRACEILIREKGLQLKCRVAGKTYLLPILEWQHLVTARLVEGPRLNRQEQKQWLAIRGGKNIPMMLRMMYLILSRECTGWFGAWELRFDFDCLLMKDRRDLRKILSEHMGRTAIDLQLSDALSPIDVASYTTLWLQCFDSAEPSRARQESLTEGTTLGNDRYVITGSVGSGGQGTAYAARCLETNESVVLKEFILPAHGDLATRQKALEHVKREAELLGNLDHPQIVSYIDFFIDDLRAYLVLEHIDGKSLRHIVQERGKLPVSETIDLAVQMCSILEYLHAQTPPVVHRDFTPENLILTQSGMIKLIDFNVALQLDSTTTKTVVGKHSYIPPEQFRGKATPASDVYALGATVYFMLCGKDPQPITSSHPRNEVPQISEELDHLVAAATALETGGRPQSPTDLKKALFESKS